MSQLNFQWTPEFWQEWRESSDPYRRYKSAQDRRIVLEMLELRDRERVLEVGCGYGWISRALWDAANIEWTGVDRSEEMLRRLRASYPDRALRALLADGCRLPFADGEFDKVLCTGVLMHISDYRAAIYELVRVLRPGGRLVCSINNILSPYAVPARLWNRRKKGFIQKFLSPRSFRRLLHDANVQLDGICGDGIIATVPVTLGRLHFPPARLHLHVCRLDHWATRRFPWLAYEVWFGGLKVESLCAF